MQMIFETDNYDFEWFRWVCPVSLVFPVRYSTTYVTMYLLAVLLLICTVMYRTPNRSHMGLRC